MINANKIFPYLVLFYVVMVLYIIPYGTTPHAKIFFPVIIFLFTLKIISQNIKFKIKELLLINFLFIITFINFSYDILTSSLIISLAFFLLKDDFEISKSYALTIYLISLIGIIYWFTYSNKLESSRVFLNNPDPNFSSLFMLLFFFYCDKNKFVLGKIIAFISIFLFLSRNYFFSIIVFYIVKLTKKHIYFLLKKIEKFYCLILILNISLLLFSFIFLKQVHFTSNIENASRLISLSDNSNYNRFRINIFFITKFFNDWEFALFGIKNYYETFHSVAGNVIHNSFLAFFAENGLLYSSVYFYLLAKVINFKFKFYNYEYIYSYMFFSLFLHELFTGTSILFFLIIMSIKNK